jgi:hypothetical protein
MAASIRPVRTVSEGRLRRLFLRGGRGKIRRVHIVLAGNSNQGEKGVAARVRERSPEPMRR